ncbi:MAG TPA: UDP-N-acetylglucosamine 2-epimerase (non-hydrolyzing), partial [Anseongella sp.]|nr:UDP-N-acetylglucosamine 2-epimerase (non-hydrolyzing) [Anseongella sp.]
EEHPADLVLVVGDVTSTLACSIVAKKLHTRVAHVEAGIRSGDMRMPEEINRLVTDAIADYFFTTSEAAGANLLKAGVSGDRIFFVGNTMIDTLLKQQPHFRRPPVWEEAGLEAGEYIVMTLHRPANVDQEQQLKSLMDAIVAASRGIPLIFPVHPRTGKMLENTGVSAPNLYMIDPLGYLEFNYLVQHAKAVVTDSGGITEETTVMGVPCMTLRDSTERPETCTIGTNELLGTGPEAVAPAFEKLFEGRWKQGGIPALWDGKAAVRIVDHLLALYEPAGTAQK